MDSTWMGDHYSGGYWKIHETLAFPGPTQAGWGLWAADWNPVEIEVFTSNQREFLWKKKSMVNGQYLSITHYTFNSHTSLIEFFEHPYADETV